MHSPRFVFMPSRLPRFAAIVLAMCSCSGLLSAAVDEPVAVFSKVFNGYARTRLADGSLKPETYVFGDGDSLPGAATETAGGKMPFAEVAKTVAVSLAHFNYQPALKSDDAQLIIFVFWGSTHGSRDSEPSYANDDVAAATAGLTSDASGVSNPSAESALDAALFEASIENEARDKIDSRNARLLGYTDILGLARSIRHMGFAQDIITEISSNRHYVILQACDFQTAHRDKKLKPLWTARISIDAHDHDFADALAHMLDASGPFLGRESGGLKRDVVPEGRVILGPAKVIHDPQQK